MLDWEQLRLTICGHLPYLDGKTLELLVLALESRIISAFESWKSELGQNSKEREQELAARKPQKQSPVTQEPPAEPRKIELGDVVMLKNDEWVSMVALRNVDSNYPHRIFECVWLNSEKKPITLVLVED